jgi:ATP-dependent helicase/DNAse subunit B
VGDKVLLINSRVKLFSEGKLHNKWMRPYTVINTSSHDAITIKDDDGNIFRANGQRLKVFLEPSHDTNIEIDKIELITFDKFIANL